MQYTVGVQVEQSRNKLTGYTPDHTHIQVLVILQYLIEVTFCKLCHYTDLHVHVHVHVRTERNSYVDQTLLLCNHSRWNVAVCGRKFPGIEA